MMISHVFKILVLLAVTTLVTGCKIAVTPIEGGDVVFSGNNISARVCRMGESCIYEVNDTSFSGALTARPDPGWDFVRWVTGEGFFCTDKTNRVCGVSSEGAAGKPALEAIIASDQTFYAQPVFQRKPNTLIYRANFGLLTATREWSRDFGPWNCSIYNLSGDIPLYPTYAEFIIDADFTGEATVSGGNIPNFTLTLFCGHDGNPRAMAILDINSSSMQAPDSVITWDSGRLSINAGYELPGFASGYVYTGFIDAFFPAGWVVFANSPLLSTYNATLPWWFEAYGTGPINFVPYPPVLP